MVGTSEDDAAKGLRGRADGPASSRDGVAGGSFCAVAGDRRVDTSTSVETLLAGSMTIASATGLLAEVLGVHVEEARWVLLRSARAQGVSMTAHARVIVDSHNGDPSAPKPAWA